MTQKEFVENIRQELREDGFMSAIKLVSTIASRAKEFKVNVDSIEGILKMIPCEDILVVEYANWLTKGYRRKDLYYFMPKE